MKVPYRLGLDLGSNSIGWFAVALERDGKTWVPRGSIGGGVRVFPDGRDPQSGASNAEDRRTARGMRRRRDRFLSRQKKLLAALAAHGLMPEDKAERKKLESLDPYELRARALDEKLPAHHVGRALFHLNQRRGFLSNRKAENKKKDDDKGAIKDAARKLDAAMEEAGARTLGEWLHGRRRAAAESKEKTPVSVRARNISGGSKAAYDFYPTRAVVEAEFKAIWDAQSPHHPSMTDDARAVIHHAIFYQRPLRPPIVGKCTLDPASVPFEQDPEGYRVSWAHPLAQRFRLWQEVRNLDVGETGRPRRKLTKEEGDAVALALVQNNKVTFDKMRTLLKLPAEARFNLESEKRDELKGDETAEKLSHKARFGKAWRGFSLERQIEIVERLLNEGDETQLIGWLQAECGLGTETASRIADALRPEGYCRLGLRAIRKILPYMEAGLDYARAAKEAGYDHAKLPTGEILDRLPYYGEWLPDAVVGTGDARHKNDRKHGRFPNPTVHISLGQLRRVVNGLIEELGHPEQIVIEFTRGLKISEKEKVELQRDQKRNQDKNKERVQKIREVLENEHYDPRPGELLKFRLWEELNPRDPLDRRCPFSGEVISLKRLLSDEVEIEHLIPYKLCLDDSPANKTVCMRFANRAKRKQTPYQAFGSSPAIDGFHYDWEAISLRAAAFPKNKLWRFDPDAHERYKDKGQDFLARQLMETGWLARVAKQYLGAVCNPNEIWVIPGRLTAMIRGRWGLNSLLPDHNYGGVQERDEGFRAATDDLEFSGIKNRADHRHHAIDAFVVALTERSLLQRISGKYDEERDKVEMPEPWEGFRDELKSHLDRMVVSHKPDHGREGRLHEDTAFGLVKEPEKEGGNNLVRRKDLITLTENEIELIRDIRLRERVRDHVYEAKAAGIDLKAALQEFATKSESDSHTKHGVRRVRLLKPEKAEYLVPVSGRNGSGAYKAYSAGENFCVEIFEAADGRWLGEAIRRFDANQSGYQPRWRADYPDARFVMRVHKGDLLRLEHDGKKQIMVVHRLDASAGRFKLAGHNETGILDKRHAASNDMDPFRWLMASYGTLKKAGAEKVRVDEIGRVWRVSPAEAH